LALAVDTARRHRDVTVVRIAADMRAQMRIVVRIPQIGANGRRMLDSAV
jgi:hypothetical protein